MATCLLAPMQVFADTSSLQTEGEELVDATLVMFDVSKPGEFVVDASNHQVILPLPAETLSFESREAFDLFVADSFPFIYQFDENAEIIGSELAIVTYGRPMAYSSDLQSLIPVTDPIATLIGGRYGLVEVAGEMYCVDPDRCENAVDPFSLVPKIRLDVEEEAPFLPDLADASLSANATASTSTAGSRIKVDGSHSIDRVSTTYGVRHYLVATTIQIAGGYQERATYTAPRLVCTGMLTFFSRVTCYWIPGQKIILSRSGQNRLSVDMDSLSWMKVNGVCRLQTVERQSERKMDNVTQIKLSVLKDWYLTPSWPYYQHTVIPTYLESYFVAEDPYWREVDWKSKRTRTPFPTSC